MKMYLDADEWYPVHSLREERREYLTEYAVEVSDELKQKHDRIMEEFEELQNELSKLRTTKIPKSR